MQPLAGIKVIEIAQNFAGPFAGKILAHLGADVIKVERPGSGDDCRGWGPPFVDGDAAAFHAVNTNKRSIALDLKDPETAARLVTMIGEADVVVQNLRPGALEKLGLDGAALTRRYPALIYCSLWAFGRQGPMRLNPGYEPMVQAFSGLMMLSGEPGGPPMRMGTQVLDFGTGMWAAIGILAALQQRAATGRGCAVDTSLFETALAWTTIHHSRFRASGQLPERHPTGSGAVVPFQAFETANGPVVIAAANDRLFAKLALALGRPEWAKDPRFKDNAGRAGNAEVLVAEIADVIRKKRKGEWIDLLDAAGVPCSPVNMADDVFADAQTLATGMIQEVPGLDLELMGLPVQFDGRRPPTRSKAPAVGEHNVIL